MQCSIKALNNQASAVICDLMLLKVNVARKWKHLDVEDVEL